MDYGKFDYVMHEGEAVLFDANKTPGFVATPGGKLNLHLAEALDSLLA
jgi:hypothetical protein